jgi:hypothetical protein
MDYREFLQSKIDASDNVGFEPLWMPGFLFDFQTNLVDWAIRKGRAAIFADCGLGKTPMQLVWAENVARKTGGRVLILTPLAVSHQTLEEATKFDIRCSRASSGDDLTTDAARLVVTNYERLHLFDRDDFAGVVCDESSILKSFNGKRRKEITIFMRGMAYRLLCSATAAPNDYIELGTSSEALGYLGSMDMLNRFFKNTQGNSATGRQYGQQTKWRFKGHAELPFWRWVCSWARAARKPSDLGFEDDGFILPPLTELEHLVEARSLRSGELFPMISRSLAEQREERRRTLPERCERIAELVNSTNKPALVWCHLNAEGDRLSRLIPDAVQVSGSNSDKLKEERLLSFAQGNTRVLVTKPKIGAWGLNFQHCSHVLLFPSHSYEQYYQGVRRCWRFGQQNPVKVEMVTTDGEAGVLSNLRRKSKQADQMFTRLVAEMNNAMSIDHRQLFPESERIPQWL